MSKIKINTVILIFITAHSSLFAYIDPGTGSFLLQLLLGAIAAGLYYFKVYLYKVTNNIKKIFKRDDPK